MKNSKLYSYTPVLSTSLKGTKVLQKMSDDGGWYVYGVHGNFLKMRKNKRCKNEEIL